MNQLTKIKYREDHPRNVLKLKIIVGTAFFGILLLILIQKLWFALALASLLLVQWIIFKWPDGIIEIAEDNGHFLLRNTSRSRQNTPFQTIESKDFSWNYAHVHFSPFSMTGSGYSTGHANYLQLKLEIKLKDGQNIAIFKELNQWESTPKNWKYKVFVPEKFKRILITSKDLRKLKLLF